MPSIHDLVAASSFQPNLPAKVQAELLAKTLRAAGHDAKVGGDPSEDRAKFVIVKEADAHHIILVNSGDAGTLRENAITCQRTDVTGRVHRHLVSSTPVPPDVAILFGDGPVARLDAALTSAQVLRNDWRLTGLSVFAEPMSQIVREHFALDVSPKNGLQTLQNIDEILVRLRPAPGQADDPAAIMPLPVVMTLTAIAVDAARRMARRAFLGAAQGHNWRGVTSFHESRGALALKVGDEVVPFGELARERLLQRQDVSLAARWTRLLATLPAEEKNLDGSFTEVLLGWTEDDGGADEPEAAKKPEDAAERLMVVGLAPYIALLKVAAADKKLEAKETAVFIPWLKSVTSNLLSSALAAAGNPTHQLEALMKNPQIAEPAMALAAQVFRESGPDGSLAITEILDLAVQVARTNATGGFLGFGEKKIRAVEQAAVDEVAKSLLAGRA